MCICTLKLYSLILTVQTRDSKYHGLIVGVGASNSIISIAIFLEIDQVAVSPVALLYYDYILTFNAEVTRFWSPLQWNLGTVVFLSIRYIAIFGHIPIVAELFIAKVQDKHCLALLLYHPYLSGIIQIIVGGMTRLFLFGIIFR